MRLFLVGWQLSVVGVGRCGTRLAYAGAGLDANPVVFLYNVFERTQGQCGYIGDLTLTVGGGWRLLAVSWRLLAAHSVSRQDTVCFGSVGRGLAVSWRLLAAHSAPRQDTFFVFFLGGGLAVSWRLLAANAEHECG